MQLKQSNFDQYRPRRSNTVTHGPWCGATVTYMSRRAHITRKRV